MLIEAEEEAGLRLNFVSDNIRGTGTLSYYNHCSAAEGGHLRPRVLHTFELELPSRHGAPPARWGGRRVRPNGPA
jgi:hypothetical protein